MAHKMPDIPPEVAKAFMEDLRAFHAEKSAIKRDEIAARQRHILLEHMPNGGKVSVMDVKEMFERMRSAR